MIRLFPPKKDFYKLLMAQTAKAEESLEALANFLREPNEVNAKAMNTIEHEADELRRILMDDLDRTFVTELDREDIYALSRSIDDIIDYAETTAEEMLIFEIKGDEYTERMVGMLREAANHIHLAVTNLSQKHPGVCTEHLIRTRKIENEIEKIYRRGLAEIFKSNDIKTIFKTREMYRHLSNAADRAVEAANVLGSIVIKTS